MNLKSDVVWLKKKIYFMQESEGGQGDLVKTFFSSQSEVTKK